MAFEIEEDYREAVKAPICDDPSDWGKIMWFSHNTEDGFKIFKTEVEAKASASEALKLEREEAQGYGEWRDDEVKEICWGKVIQKVKITKREPAPPEAEFDEYIDYDLQDVS